MEKVNTVRFSLKTSNLIDDHVILNGF